MVRCQRPRRLDFQTGSFNEFQAYRSHLVQAAAMKFRFGFVMLARLLLIAFTLALVAPMAQANEFYVGTDVTLNARSGPGTSFGIVKRLSPGTRLVEIAREGEWSRVRLADKQQAWVHVDYIVANKYFGITGYWVRSGSRAEIRVGPSSGSRLLGRVGSGWKLRETERQGNWSRVYLETGNEVWIDNRMLVDTATYLHSHQVDTCVGHARCQKVVTCNDNETGPSTKRCFKVDVSSIGGRPLSSYKISRIGSAFVHPEDQKKFRNKPACRQTDGHVFTSGGIPEPVLAVSCVDGDDPRCSSDRRWKMRRGLMNASAAFLAGGERHALIGINALESWAEANALLINEAPDNDNHLGQWWQKEMLGSLINAYALFRGRADAESRRKIEKWLHRLVYAQNVGSGQPSHRRGYGSRSYLKERWGVNYTNHRYLRDFNAMRWGALVGDDLLYQQGIERYWIALHQMRGDGSYPWESSRGYRAVGYTHLVVSILVGMAEVASLQGHDLYGLHTSDGRSIHTAVKWSIDAMENLGLAAKYARINQGSGGHAFDGRQDFGFIHFTLGWIEAYMKRFPDHDNTRRLRALRLANDAQTWNGMKIQPITGPRSLLERRPHNDQIAGANTTCLFAER